MQTEKRRTGALVKMTFPVRYDRLMQVRRRRLYNGYVNDKKHYLSDKTAEKNNHT